MTMQGELDLDIHYLLRRVYHNFKGKYTKFTINGLVYCIFASSTMKLNDRMRNVRTAPLCYMQTVKALIKLCSRAVWSEPSQLVGTFYRWKSFLKRAMNVPDQTTKMHRLICVIVARSKHKGRLRTLLIIRREFWIFLTTNPILSP